MQGINPVGNFQTPLSSFMDASSYKLAIDAGFSSLQREGSRFAPMTWPRAFGAILGLLVAPGHYYDGSVLNEIGAWTTGDVTIGTNTILNVANVVGVSIGMMAVVYQFSSVTLTGNTNNGSADVTSVSSTAGVFIGMNWYGPGIQPGSAVANIVGSTVTLTKTAQATASGVTMNASGASPLTPIFTPVSNIVGSTVTLLNNALGTLAGAYIMFCRSVGTVVTGDTHSGTNVIDNMLSLQGVFPGLAITGTNIAGGAKVQSILSPTSIQLTMNSTGSGSGVTLTFTIPPPASGARIDLVSVNALTGTLVWIMGAPAGSPVPPALPAGSLPVAMTRIATADTILANNGLADVRDLSAMGLGSGAFVSATAFQSNVLGIVAGYTGL